MILTKQELSDISGLKRPDAVRRWLDRQKIPYLVGADGWPRVLQDIMMDRMGAKVRPVPVKEPELLLHHVF